MAALALAIDLARTVAVRPAHLVDASHERWINKDREFCLEGYARYLAGVPVLEPEDCAWFWAPEAVDTEDWPAAVAEPEPVVEIRRNPVPWIPVVGAWGEGALA